MRLFRIQQPFDHPDWLYEVKWDGFRALAYIANGECSLVSRKGIPYKSFRELARWMGSNIAADVILDGEIVCLDQNGQPDFNRLLYRRGDCYHFYAFDL